MKLLKSSYLAIFIFCLYALSDSLYAQDLAGVLRDYDRGRLDKVREALITLRPGSYNRPEYIFLTAVLEEDGERAFSLYGELNANSQDNQVFERVLLRMCQYYYAKGLYEICAQNLERFVAAFPDSENLETARRMKNCIALYLGEKIPGTPQRLEEKIPETRQRVEGQTTIYTIQLGVFRQESNARNQRDYLRNLGIAQAYIKEHRVASDILYKIWAGDFTSRDEAIKMCDELKRKYKITDIIVTEKK